MKRIVNLVFHDLFTREFSELLDSWALIFAIVPFGALIFSGMWVGQFVLDSTGLGVLLMFVFPLIGFAILYAVRKAIATARIPPMPTLEVEMAKESTLVVVRIEGSADDGKRPMYALRRLDAIENMYVQKGYAPSVAELRSQVAGKYPDVDWNHIVAEPTKSLAASMQRSEARSG
jgi:hypothetical protein